MSAIFKIQSWIPITFRVESKGNMGPGDSTVQCVDRCVSILVCSSDHILHPDSWCTQTSCTSSISHLDDCSRLCAHNPLPICSNTSLFKDTRDQIESLKIFTAPGVLEMQQDFQVVSGLSRTLDCGVPTIPVSTLPSPVLARGRTMSTSLGVTVLWDAPRGKGRSSPRTSWFLKQSWSLWVSCLLKGDCYSLKRCWAQVQWCPYLYLGITEGPVMELGDTIPLVESMCSWIP